MNLVTIIIPMYNEENSVEKCIKSLCNQSNQNFNVIFVDDGSTDDTLEKLKKILANNIIFNYEIRLQENKGAAAARKNGIEASKTPFIMMLDCDDMLSDDMVEAVYSQYESHVDADIFVPTMCIQNKNQDWSELIIYTNELSLIPEECVKNSLDGWKIHGCCTFKKEIFLKSYKDYEEFNILNQNFINNDEILTRLNFLNSKKIFRIESKYFYYYNKSSTTKKFNKNKFLMINNALILNEILGKHQAFKLEALSELISVIWGAHMYKFKHKKIIKNHDEWGLLIKKSLKEIVLHNNFFKLRVKKKIQLFVLKLIYLV